VTADRQNPENGLPRCLQPAPGLRVPNELSPRLDS